MTIIDGGAKKGGKIQLGRAAQMLRLEDMRIPFANIPTVNMFNRNSLKKLNKMIGQRIKRAAEYMTH